VYAERDVDSPLFRSELHLRRCLRLGVEYKGAAVCRFLARSELDPMLARLHEHDPGVFDFSHHAPRWQARVYQAYAKARRRLPLGAALWADRHLRLVLAVFGLPLLVGDILMFPRRRGA
jgi:hypothetical protein